MITFSRLGSLGRLGNQLFQYAALKSVGIKNNYEVKIPDPALREWQGQKCLLDNFNLECNYLEHGDEIKYIYQEPDAMKFDSVVFNIPDGTDIGGFFQSTYYFKECESQIKKELTPKDEFLDLGREEVGRIRKLNPGYEIVSLHLRRGDNTDNTDPNQVELNNMYGIDKLNSNSFYGRYFKKAKAVFKGKKVKFLVFTGGNRGPEDNHKDIEWCKNSFGGDDYIFSDNSNTIVDFCMIMSCDHNILSHVSSFGWWAAFLNQHQNKLVVGPNKYHPDLPSLNHREGFYPKEYILV
jgi:hypothetical protein